MTEDYIIQHPKRLPSQRRKVSEYDRIKFSLSPLGDDFYIGKSLELSNNPDERILLALLFFGRKVEDKFYLLEMNPTLKSSEIFFSFLHVLDTQSCDKKEGLLGNTYNWLPYKRKIIDINKQFSFKSVDSVLEDILSNVTLENVKDILSYDNLNEVVTYKGAHWNNDTLIRSCSDSHLF
ncbi:MAG: hypothetical protein PF569_00550 [Candidatus Woesearchaeota archaeon]|jgi:hypothetical protein|nr:hypothetical protein [Candidatus Woesearchaeota archaeon]